MKFERLQQTQIADQDSLDQGERQPQKSELRQEKPRELAAEKIRSAKSEAEKLAADSQWRLDGIERGIGSPAEDIIAVRKETGILQKIEKIKDEACTLVIKLKKKVYDLLAKKESVANGTNTEEIERELNDSFIREARSRLDQIFENRGLFQMSKADFEKYFASKELNTGAELKQQNNADCYIISSIHAISCSPSFETIVRSSMKKLPNGSWEVKIPLFSDGGQMITIAPEELSPQKNKRAEDAMTRIMRGRLRLVEGKEGMQVIEAAFIKQKFGSVDLSAAAYGDPSDVLLALGGDNFKKFSVAAEKHDQETGRYEHPGLNELSDEDLSNLDHYLKSFDPETHIATASSKSGRAAGKLGVFGVYKGEGVSKIFVTGHAYSISRVDTRGKIVILADPYNTTKPIELTFDQFKRTFNRVDGVRIDNAKILSNMKKVIEKKAA